MGEEGDQENGDHVDQGERHDPGEDLLDRGVGNTRSDEDILAKRRGLKTDGERADHDDAEMGGIDAEIVADRQEHRRQDQDGRERLHEHADEQQEQDDDRPEDVEVLGGAQHPLGDDRGDAVLDQKAAEHGRGEQDQEHAAREPGGGGEAVAERFPLELAVNDDADKEGVEDGDDRGFGRGEVAGVDSAEDHQRR